MKRNTISVKSLTINHDYAGQRIDNFLFNKLKGVPKSKIYHILRKGEVRINKKRVKPKYKLKQDDQIRIPPINIIEYDKKNSSLNLQKIVTLSSMILYEDDHVLVLNKPSGTIVHSYSKLNAGLIERLRAMRSEVHFLELVHRLDRDASGVLLLAKKRSTLRSLHEQLRKHEVKKDYLALVRGHWPAHLREIKVPLLKFFFKRGKRNIVRVNQDGKKSKTIFQIEERYQLATLMRCIPVTGRTHQIRVHTQYAGHPIAFDDLYGDREFDKYLLKTGLSRLFLHAASMTFTHPNTSTIIRIEAPLDIQLESCLKKLRNN